jgi:hypothetical protein
VLFISSFVGFVTWLTLSAAGLDAQIKLWATVGMFLFVAVLLVNYMLACMRRHCADDRHHHHHMA